MLFVTGLVTFLAIANAGGDHIKGGSHIKTVSSVNQEKIAQEDIISSPYNFNINPAAAYGTKITREETGDADGRVKGSYTVANPRGTSRIGQYLADDTGFHASVKTPEPNTKTHRPANAQIEAVSKTAAAPSLRQAVKTISQNTGKIHPSSHLHHAASVPAAQDQVTVDVQTGDSDSARSIKTLKTELGKTRFAPQDRPIRDPVARPIIQTVKTIDPPVDDSSKRIKTVKMDTKGKIHFSVDDTQIKDPIVHHVVQTVKTVKDPAHDSSKRIKTLRGAVTVKTQIVSQDTKIRDPIARPEIQTIKTAQDHSTRVIHLTPQTTKTGGKTSDASLRRKSVAVSPDTTVKTSHRKTDFQRTSPITESIVEAARRITLGATSPRYTSLFDSERIILSKDGHPNVFSNIGSQMKTGLGAVEEDGKIILNEEMLKALQNIDGVISESGQITLNEEAIQVIQRIKDRNSGQTSTASFSSPNALKKILAIQGQSEQHPRQPARLHSIDGLRKADTVPKPVIRTVARAQQQPLNNQIRSVSTSSRSEFSSGNTGSGIQVSRQPIITTGSQIQPGLKIVNEKGEITLNEEMLKAIQNIPGVINERGEITLNEEAMQVIQKIKHRSYSHVSTASLSSSDTFRGNVASQWQGAPQRQTAKLNTADRLRKPDIIPKPIIRNEDRGQQALKTQIRRVSTSSGSEFSSVNTGSGIQASRQPSISNTRLQIQPGLKIANEKGEITLNEEMLKAIQNIPGVINARGEITLNEEAMQVIKKIKNRSSSQISTASLTSSNTFSSNVASQWQGASQSRQPAKINTADRLRKPDIIPRPILRTEDRGQQALKNQIRRVSTSSSSEFSSGNTGSGIQVSRQPIITTGSQIQPGLKIVNEKGEITLNEEMLKAIQNIPGVVNERGEITLNEEALQVIQQIKHRSYSHVSAASPSSSNTFRGNVASQWQGPPQSRQPAKLNTADRLRKPDIIPKPIIRNDDRGQQALKTQIRRVSTSSGSEFSSVNTGSGIQASRQPSISNTRLQIQPGLKTANEKGEITLNEEMLKAIQNIPGVINARGEITLNEEAIQVIQKIKNRSSSQISTASLTSSNTFSGNVASQWQGASQSRQPAKINTADRLRKPDIIPRPILRTEDRGQQALKNQIRRVSTSSSSEFSSGNTGSGIQVSRQPIITTGSQIQPGLKIVNEKGEITLNEEMLKAIQNIPGVVNERGEITLNEEAMQVIQQIKHRSYSHVSAASPSSSNTFRGNVASQWQGPPQSRQPAKLNTADRLRKPDIIPKPIIRNDDRGQQALKTQIRRVSTSSGSEFSSVNTGSGIQASRQPSISNTRLQIQPGLKTANEKGEITLNEEMLKAIQNIPGVINARGEITLNEEAIQVIQQIKNRSSSQISTASLTSSNAFSGNVASQWQGASQSRQPAKINTADRLRKPDIIPRPILRTEDRGQQALKNQIRRVSTSSSSEFSSGNTGSGIQASRQPIITTGSQIQPGLKIVNEKGEITLNDEMLKAIQNIPGVINERGEITLNEEAMQVIQQIKHRSYSHVSSASPSSSNTFRGNVASQWQGAPRSRQPAKLNTVDRLRKPDIIPKSILRTENRGQQQALNNQIRRVSTNSRSEFSSANIGSGIQVSRQPIISTGSQIQPGLKIVNEKGEITLNEEMLKAIQNIPGVINERGEITLNEEAMQIIQNIRNRSSGQISTSLRSSNADRGNVVGLSQSTPFSPSGAGQRNRVTSQGPSSSLAYAGIDRSRVYPVSSDKPVVGDTTNIRGTGSAHPLGSSIPLYTLGTRQLNPDHIPNYASGASNSRSKVEQEKLTQVSQDRVEVPLIQEKQEPSILFTDKADSQQQVIQEKEPVRDISKTSHIKAPSDGSSDVSAIQFTQKTLDPVETSQSQQKVDDVLDQKPFTDKLKIIQQQEKVSGSFPDSKALPKGVSKATFTRITQVRQTDIDKPLVQQRTNDENLGYFPRESFLPPFNYGNPQISTYGNKVPITQEQQKIEQVFV